MNFKREKIQNYYLHDTLVENVFINEFMIDANGDYVKVYLLALMHAEINMPITNEAIAKQLSLAEEDVLKAWTYWEDKCVISRHYSDPDDRYHYKVELRNLKEQVFGKAGKSKRDEEGLPDSLLSLMSDQDLKKMYSQIEQITGRLFEGKEPGVILNWIKDLGVSPDLVVFAYDHCTQKRKNNKHNYVATVIKEWAGKGLKTVPEVEQHLSETDSRHYTYKRILKALGFLRNPTEEEKRIMDTWFDTLGFDLPRVLTACGKTSGISNPNINYVNTILKAWSNETKPGGDQPNPSQNPIAITMKSYDEERGENEAAAEARRKEVYGVVPRIKEIEVEIRTIGMEISKQMLSSGFGSKTKISDLKSRLDSLNTERSYLLTDNNFKINYMDTWYTCPLCKDTGLLDSGDRCSCFSAKLDRNGKKV